MSRCALLYGTLSCALAWHLFGDLAGHGLASDSFYYLRQNEAIDTYFTCRLNPSYHGPRPTWHSRWPLL